MAADDNGRPLRSARHGTPSEEAWLLARERGEPGPLISHDIAARYARLEALLARLPPTLDGIAPRRGWQARVFAEIDARIAVERDAAELCAGKLRS